MNPFGPLFFVGGFLITELISLIVRGLNRLSLSFCFDLDRLYIFISSRLSSVYIQFFILFSFNPFYFCGIGFNVPSFISDCSYESCFFFFFLVNPAKDLSRQFIFDLESLSWFNIQSACDVLEM